MSRILEPLEPFREHLTIVSGLRNKPGETPEPHGYIEHDVADVREARGTTAWRARTPASAADQLAARHIGQDTRLPSLELDDGAARRPRGVAHAHAVAAAGRQPARGVPEAVRPGRHREGTRGHPGGDGQHPRSRARRRRSGCRRASACRTAWWSATISTRCARSSAACRWPRRRICQRARHSRRARSACRTISTEHFKLMFDLMALAFQADITRVITFSMDREASMRTYTNLSIAEAFHPLSHHGNDRAEAGQAGADPDVSHGGVREVRRAAGEDEGRHRHACWITRRSCSAAT